MTAMALLDRDDDRDLGRWLLAAAIVLAVHAGIAATYFLWFSQAPAGAPQSPPVLIDMSPLPASPESPMDIAPGPEMVEAQPPPEPQVIEPPPPEPIVEPPPPAVDPVVALPEPPKEPPPPPQVKEEPAPKPPEVKRVERKKPAPRTTASPRSKQTADTPSAASVGASSSAAIASWRDQVVAQLQRAKRYPSGAEARRETGIVTLNFTLSRSGSVLSRSIARSSGHSELDQEVLAMVARASPFPQFPPGMNQASINLSVPIRFSLR
jgi:protein TonB